MSVCIGTMALVLTNEVVRGCCESVNTQYFVYMYELVLNMVCLHIGNKTAQSAALAHRREVPSLIPGSQTRPADIYLPSWKRGCPTALDLTVISTLQQATIQGALGPLHLSQPVTSSRECYHPLERQCCTLDPTLPTIILCTIS